MFATAACSPSYKRASEAQIDFLASDAHVIVGGLPLTLPFVALPEYVAAGPSFSLDRTGDREHAQQRLESFRTLAERPRTAPVLDKLRVDVSAYGWNDFDTSFDRICPRLSRLWARSVCDDPWAPLAQATPNNPFYLYDVGRPDAFETHWTVSGKRRSDELRAMRLKAGEVSTVCNDIVPGETRHCTAAVLIDGNLGAVWNVWDSANSRETHRQRAEREGTAIAAFVMYALGPSENFPRLTATSCASKEPGKNDGPTGKGHCPDGNGSRASIASLSRPTARRRSRPGARRPPAPAG